MHTQCPGSLAYFLKKKNLVFIQYKVEKINFPPEMLQPKGLLPSSAKGPAKLGCVCDLFPIFPQPPKHPTLKVLAWS